MGVGTAVVAAPGPLDGKEALWPVPDAVARPVPDAAVRPVAGAAGE